MIDFYTYPEPTSIREQVKCFEESQRRLLPKRVSRGWLAGASDNEAAVDCRWRLLLICVLGCEDMIYGPAGHGADGHANGRQ